MMLELERVLLPTVGLRAGSGVEKWGGTLVKVLGMLLQITPGKNFLIH
jgi:hypothetical protein